MHSKPCDLGIPTVTKCSSCVYLCSMSLKAILRFSCVLDLPILLNEQAWQADQQLSKELS